jgi:hypothetical protein
MATTKVFLRRLAKAIFVTIPLVVGYMFGISRAFDWLSDTHGLPLPGWMQTLVLVAGIYGIIAITIGSDLMAMKRAQGLKKGA